MGEETLYARQRFLCCAKAYGLQAIDSVYIDIKDVDGLRKQSEQGLHKYIHYFLKALFLTSLFSHSLQQIISGYQH